MLLSSAFLSAMLLKVFENQNPLQQQQQQQILLKIRNISNYISFPRQIVYKVIGAGISEGILQVQGLSIDSIQ